MSGKDALHNADSNPFNRWPKRDGGANRVEPICKPEYTASFKLEPGAKVFTVGSCFARNVEEKLAELGFDLPAWRILLTDPEFQSFGPAMLNNYAAPSIYNEISWALDPSNPFSLEQNVYEVYPGKFIDVHLIKIRPAPLDIVAKRREAIIQIYREIADCPLVIMTLGLTEAWYDRETALYLNTRPHRSMMNESKDRYELHVLDYADTISYLSRTFDLLRTHRKKGAHVLLTVSPVPLTMTYRDIDIVTANMYSKSVLRAAAEEIVSRYDFVEYIPTYESVVLTRRDLAWIYDQVHVTKDLVEINVARMIAAYTGTTFVPSEAVETLARETPAEPAADDQAIHDAIVDGSVTNADAIIRFGDEHGQLVAADPALAAKYCNACLKRRRLGEARAALASIPMTWEPVSRGVLEARLLMAEKDYKPAKKRLRELVTGQESSLARKELARQLLLQAIVASEPVEAAVRFFSEWETEAGSVASSNAFRTLALALAAAGDAEHADRYFREGLTCGDASKGRILTDYIEFLAGHGRMEEAERQFATITGDDERSVTRRRALASTIGLGSEKEFGRPWREDQRARKAARNLAIKSK
jgi:hypothetical protein